jgi:hypothetical protein
LTKNDAIKKVAVQQVHPAKNVRCVLRCVAVNVEFHPFRQKKTIATCSPSNCGSFTTPTCRNLPFSEGEITMKAKACPTKRVADLAHPAMSRQEFLTAWDDLLRTFLLQDDAEFASRNSFAGPYPLQQAGWQLSGRHNGWD